MYKLINYFITFLSQKYFIFEGTHTNIGFEKKIFFKGKKNPFFLFIYIFSINTLTTKSYFNVNYIRLRSYLNIPKSYVC